MPRYLVERRFSVSPDDMPDVGRKSRQIAEEHFPEIVWEHSHVVVEDTGNVTTFCVYGAPSEDVIRRHAEALGAHDIAAIREIAGDVTPADFPL